MHSKRNTPSPTKVVFESVAAALELSPECEAGAQHFYYSLRDGLSLTDRVLVRCCVFFALKARANPQVDISKLLQGPNPITIGQFVSGLERALASDLPEDLKCTVNLKLYDFHLNFKIFSKFKQNWTELGLEGRKVHCELAFEVCWLVFIVGRVELLGKSTDLADCGHMLKGVLCVVLGALPPGLSLASSLETSKHTAPWVERVSVFLSDLKGKGVLTGGGLLHAENVHLNITALQGLYNESLEPEDLDERDFITKSFMVTPVKEKTYNYFNRRGDSGQFINNSVLEFIDFPQITVNPGITDFLAPRPSPTVNISTPITMDMELRNWLRDLEDDHSLTSSETTITDISREMSQKAENLFGQKGPNNTDFLLQNFGETGPQCLAPTGQASSSLALYKKVLSQLCGESSKTGLRALFACCLETTLYISGDTAISLVAILEACEIQAMDLWGALKSYIESPLKLPTPLKWHFLEIESKILNCLAWTDPGLIARTPAALAHLTEDSLICRFIQKVLSYSAQRILAMCKHHPQAVPLQNSSWSVLKHLLAEHTVLMQNRHLDQLLLCAVFGAAKSLKEELRFSKLIEQHKQISKEDSSLYYNVVVTEDSSQNIVQFYNAVFLPCMKDCLVSLQKHSAESTGILTHCAPLPSLPSSCNSPFMTPRTQQLRAVASPVCRPLQRKISFDQPLSLLLAPASTEEEIPLAHSE